MDDEPEERNAAVEILMEWGAIKALKRIILTLGRELFGEPTPEHEQTVRGIEDLDRLNRLVLRILNAATWDDLLGDADPVPHIV